MFKTLLELFKKDNNEPHDIDAMIGDLDKLLSHEQVIEPGQNSREQGEFKGNPMQHISIMKRLNLIPILIKNMRELKKSYRGLDQTPDREKINQEELERINQQAEELGVDSIGYTTVNKDDIFLNRGILYSQAIVFSIEMDQEDIQTAPSFQSLKTVQDTYAQTGVVANKITNSLREMGFGAQSGPGLGGQTIYPVLAKRARLGAFGRHGILITPENGPTHRLGVIYTNIKNLPTTGDNKHEWINDFCQQCGKCIESCPVDAIYEEPVTTTADNIAFIDNDTCVEYFARNYGCSICIKECPFNQVGYHKIKENFLVTTK
ncbi:4Fe-4S protein [Halobacteroides halobius DSM 5150]|uniref:4Fe-4S protein n=1 Tax=Halobacteroides halobius (strain ATCC 35273 / DSM 5150 / MD-1) TaxID=748449 RepID=L0K8K0_HALHC|nr:4Fe-4S double cluster binding domain-containing protein [Halobacteroides halobius]AGB40448.1 4Fe-4S protein [Halobacteroides halobius DSM 5150]